MNLKNKRINIKIKKIYIRIYMPLLLIFSIFSGFILISSNAEQSGSSPDTGGAQSILVKTYKALVSKGTTYGSSSSPDWTNDWGTYWNRIMYSATWEPDGTATSSDVLSGKTFYSGLNNRTIQTGTASPSSFGGIDYSLYQYVEYDDNYTGDYEGEESTWTNTNSTSGSEVWYDTRTGLYWSYSLGTYTNIFSSPSSGYCDFFDSEPRGTYDGSDADCGNAINACGTLSLASTQGESADTDWYLPSHKEQHMAYVNGIYNQAGATFTTTNSFFSSTEHTSSSSYAWHINFHTGYTRHAFKTFTIYYIRCVRRD
jgi:hypothetical protein